METQTKIQPSWVFSLADYRQMFDLSPQDLKRSLLDYPAGISSFNAEMQQLGHRVISGDSIYNCSLNEIRAISEVIYKANEQHLHAHMDILRSESDVELEQIYAAWQKSRQLFLEDYPEGKKEHRYQFMQLPRFPFEDFSMDIALCSAHLFHSSIGKNGHREALVAELCRVAKEVRVFPLLDEHGEITEALGHVMLTFQQKNYGIEIRQVPYHQMKGGNAMLRLWSRECLIDPNA